MIPYIDTTMLQSNLEIKPDADGEERVLLVDVVLELDMKLYQEETETILLDVYTPNWNVSRRGSRRCWNSWW